MTSISSSQLTLNFEPSLPDRFSTLREFVAYRVNVQPKSQKVIAADMDMSPSTLSRKLNPQEADTQRFNLDDLEDYLKSTKDAGAIIEYLAAKYLDNDEARKARMINRVESMLNEGTSQTIVAASSNSAGFDCSEDRSKPANRASTMNWVLPWLGIVLKPASKRTASVPAWRETEEMPL